MRKIIYYVIIILLFIVLYFMTFINREFYIQKKINIINHPEFLPNLDLAKNTSFGFKNVKADIYWIRTIQYIGSNGVTGDYKKYLFEMLNIITHINPYFEEAYNFGLLLLPGDGSYSENISKEEVISNNEKARLIGLKGIKNICDPKKIDLIKNEINLEKIWNDNKYKNPCTSDDIPFFLAYVYQFHFKDSENASFYYKVASAVEGGRPGSKIMAAVSLSRGGIREKSVLLFLTLAKDLKENYSEETGKIINYLESISYNFFQNNINFTKKDIEYLNLLGRTIYENNEEDIYNTNPNTYILKLIREINLAYLERANLAYFKDSGVYFENPNELYLNGYIEIIPIDFQQEENSGINYVWDPEKNIFDYIMKKNN